MPERKGAMIKANELRIGNLVSDNNASDSFYAAVKKLDYSRCYYGQFHSSYNDLKPIPLTEEWLVRFGFEKFEGWDGINCVKKDDVEIEIRDGKFFNSIDKEIKYIHQLQNLYFALTGEELELKAKEA